MVPIKHIRIELEKQAAIGEKAARAGEHIYNIGKLFSSIGRGAIHTGTFIKKHPVALTSGLAGVAGIYALSSLANRSSNLYNTMINAQQKDLMIRQNNILQQIASASNKQADDSNFNTQQLAIEPLA